jgi:hypothetical protein
MRYLKWPMHGQCCPRPVAPSFGPGRRVPITLMEGLLAILWQTAAGAK